MLPYRRQRPLRTARIWAAAVAVFGLVACAPGPVTVAGPTAPLAASGDPRDLRGICPDPVVVQTSWYAESTQGGLYQLLGGGYQIDAAHKRVVGPLVAGGVSTGVRIEIRAGGPALGGTSVASLMATDKTITLGQQATEEQIAGWSAHPQAATVAVLAPFDLDPVVLIWDADRHPNFTTISDIGQTSTPVFTFDSPNTDYLVGAGILRQSQINYSYDGSPRFLLADRNAVVGGFSTNEPYIYRSLGVAHLGYAYVANSGYPDYRNTLVVRQDALPALTPCLRRLVPILQQSMIGFMVRPDPALALIVKLDTAYRATYPYTQAQGRCGVVIAKRDAVVADPADPALPFGGISLARVAQMLTILRPIYAGHNHLGQHHPVPKDLGPDALATNQFLAPIHLPELPRNPTAEKACS